MLKYKVLRYKFKMHLVVVRHLCLLIQANKHIELLILTYLVIMCKFLVKRIIINKLKLIHQLQQNKLILKILLQETNNAFNQVHNRLIYFMM
jgi:hypothetical protein